MESCCEQTIGQSKAPHSHITTEFEDYPTRERSYASTVRSVSVSSDFAGEKWMEHTGQFIPGLTEALQKRQERKKERSERQQLRGEAKRASTAARRASVRRIHRAAANEDTFSRWLEKVQPGRSNYSIFKKEQKIVLWWELRDICPFCRSEDCNRTAKRPFELPSGYIVYISGFYCFRCEQMYVGPDVRGETFF